MDELLDLTFDLFATRTHFRVETNVNSEIPQVVVDERQQFAGGLSVTGHGGFEEASHVGHEGRVYRRVGAASSKT